jgi:lipoate---protein ligase
VRGDPDTVTAGWRVEERVGPPDVLHGSWPTTEREPAVRAVAVCRATAPAVVLGSTQEFGVVDGPRAAAAGVSVVRRRSGGGAVLVGRDDPLWIDVWLPAGDPLASDDVVQAFEWLGRAWADALAAASIAGLDVHRGRPRAAVGPAAAVCFAGTGSGEVVTRDGGRKVVGLAQRRNRAGAWFQCSCALRWAPRDLLGLLVLAPDDRAAAASSLEGAAVGVLELPSGAGSAPRDRRSLVAAFLAALP